MRRRVFTAALAVYLGVVLWLTLRPLPGESSGPILIPLLDTWEKMRDFGDKNALMEATRNVLLFIPFGYLVPASIRRLRSFRTAIAVGAAASALIELTQWLFGVGRSPSIDDVIYNTTGAGIGAGLFVLLTGLWRHRRDERKRRRQLQPSANGRSDSRREEVVESDD